MDDVVFGWPWKRRSCDWAIHLLRAGTPQAWWQHEEGKFVSRLGDGVVQLTHIERTIVAYSKDFLVVVHVVGHVEHCQMSEDD